MLCSPSTAPIYPVNKTANEIQISVFSHQFSLLYLLQSLLSYFKGHGRKRIQDSFCNRECLPLQYFIQSALLVKFTPLDPDASYLILLAMKFPWRNQLLGVIQHLRVTPIC